MSELQVWRYTTTLLAFDFAAVLTDLVHALAATPDALGARSRRCALLSGKSSVLKGEGTSDLGNLLRHIRQSRLLSQVECVGVEALGHRGRLLGIEMIQSHECGVVYVTARARKGRRGEGGRGEDGEEGRAEGKEGERERG
eukprot:794091-Rhodomonas_salina.1